MRKATYGWWVAIGISLATLGHAQGSYENAYVRYVEGELSLQRAAAPDTETAEVNTPILPGDRVWTHDGSRAEIRYANGTVLYLDENTKVDFVAFEAEPSLLLWNGAAIVKIEQAPYLRIDTPAGSFYPHSEGTYRLDMRDGVEMTLSVEQGSGELASTAGSVVLRSGQTSRLEAGAPPASPIMLRTSRADGLQRFRESRELPAPWRRGVPLAEVPDEVGLYVDELDRNGDWERDPSYGYVWYPSVGTGWAPYTNGYWGYTYYGYTWISYEPWGWAPYHYGRWGYNRRGWYWVPGHTWAPAWVSIAIGPGWIGWCPLGLGGGPVFPYKFHHRHPKGGHHRRARKAVPRGGFGHDGGWSYVRSDAFGKRSRDGRLRGSDLDDTAGRAELHAAGAVLDRDLRPRAIDPQAGQLGVLGQPRTVPLDASRALRRRARTVDRRAVGVSRGSGGPRVEVRAHELAPSRARSAGPGGSVTPSRRGTPARPAGTSPATRVRERSDVFRRAASRGTRPRSTVSRLPRGSGARVGLRSPGPTRRAPARAHAPSRSNILRAPSSPGPRSGSGVTRAPSRPRTTPRTTAPRPRARFGNRTAPRSPRRAVPTRPAPRSTTRGAGISGTRAPRRPQTRGRGAVRTTPRPSSPRATGRSRSTHVRSPSRTRSRGAGIRSRGTPHRSSGIGGSRHRGGTRASAHATRSRSRSGTARRGGRSRPRGNRN